MGKPLMLQEADAKRLEALKRRIRARSKVDVVRRALALLEREAERAERVVRWARAARVAAPESRRVNREFRAAARLHDLD